MGNIWETYGETYGEHMGSTPKATPNKTFPFPCWCSTLKDSQASTKFVLKVCLLSTKMAKWILDRRPELMKSWLDSKLQSLPSASTWCCKREVAVSFFASCAMTKRRRCMKNYKVKPTASRTWGWSISSQTNFQTGLKLHEYFHYMSTKHRTYQSIFWSISVPVGTCKQFLNLIASSCVHRRESQ